MAMKKMSKQERIDCSRNILNSGCEQLLKIQLATALLSYNDGDLFYNNGKVCVRKVDLVRGGHWEIIMDMRKVLYGGDK